MKLSEVEYSAGAEAVSNVKSKTEALVRSDRQVMVQGSKVGKRCGLELSEADGMDLELSSAYEFPCGEWGMKDVEREENV